jgi:hypothetical protein
MVMMSNDHKETPPARLNELFKHPPNRSQINWGGAVIVRPEIDTLHTSL